MVKRSNYHFLTYLILGLSVFGLLMVGNASPVTALRDFGDQWHYFKLQAVWASLGVVGFIVASGYPHLKLEKLATPLFLFTLVLLTLVLIPGLGNSALGARRWLGIGPLSFQPAELAKLTASIYLAKLFKSHARFVHLAIISGLLSVLIMLEPDMGTTIVVMGVCIITFLGSGGKIRYLLLSAPIVGLLATSLIIVSPYRLARLKTFADFSHDPLGASYQIRQALISLGSGGIFGVGLGQSRQKYDFLPEVTTDSVFAVIGEEMGILGSAALVIAYLGLAITGLQISRNSTHRFSAILSLAISSWLGLQSFINMSANIALLPFTGIPLPFISYGGTALLVNLVASGILVNIGKSAHA